MHRLELDGLVHLWGSAGVGKTLFAALLAADFSRYGSVEWINTDAKMAFVKSLKLNIENLGGRLQKINVTLARNHQNARNAILRLTKYRSERPLLCVIDPITRALDLTRNSPILWEREFLEEVLPSVAAFASGVEAVIATSECRTLSGIHPVPILHNALSKWADHELHLKRSMRHLTTDVYRVHAENNESFRICSLQLRSDGTPQLCDKPKSFIQWG